MKKIGKPLNQVFIIKHLNQAVDGSYQKGNENAVQGGFNAKQHGKQQKQLYIPGSYNLQGKNGKKAYEKQQHIEKSLYQRPGIIFIYKYSGSDNIA